MRVCACSMWQENFAIVTIKLFARACSALRFFFPRPPPPPPHRSQHSSMASMCVRGVREICCSVYVQHPCADCVREGRGRQAAVAAVAVAPAAAAVFMGRTRVLLNHKSRGRFEVSTSRARSSFVTGYAGIQAGKRWG